MENTKKEEGEVTVPTGATPEPEKTTTEPVATVTTESTPHTTDVPPAPVVPPASLPTPEVVEILPEVTATVAMRPTLSPSQRTWAAFIGGILVTVGGWYMYQYLTTPTLEGEATANFPAVVATVNGEAVTGVDLEQGIKQTTDIATSQGSDVSSPEAQAAIQEQALTILTNTRLLVQVATADGNSATEAEVTEQLQSIEEQFGGSEALASQAASLGLTNDDLREDIREQIIVDAYLRGKLDEQTIEVTEADIAQVYNELVAQGQELPPLESISEAIKAQIISQKQQEAIGVLVETLRAEADIEILI